MPISKLSITEIPKKLTIQEKHEILGVITYLYWDIPFEPTSSEAKIPVKERKKRLQAYQRGGLKGLEEYMGI
ncbi:MAG: hypothetical protein QXX95_02930 [Nitrososphaerales archaeon]